jgi:hypothetical protein
MNDVNENFLKITLVDDWMRKLTIDTRLQTLSEIPTNDLLLLLIAQQIERKQDKTVSNSVVYLFSQFRVYISGSSNNIDKKDAFKSEKVLMNVKMEQKDLKRSLKNLVEMRFIQLKGTNWSLHHIHPQEIVNFIKTNQHNFSTEIIKFTV